MATTTNYGWTTPDDTALVKDGASAIRTLGTSVDTTTKALNPSTTLGDIEYRSSTANTNTRVGIGSSGQCLQVVAGVPSWAASPTSVLTTTGDSLYASSANTLARLGIGTAGQVLTVNAGATAPEWKTASSGGLNWTQRLQTGLIALRTIASSGSIYVAVGSGGILYSSTDGITWTSRTSGFGSNSIYRVAYGNGLFVAVGANGTLTTSSDGITWTARTANMGANGILNVIYANSLWVAVGGGGGTTNTGGLIYSSDGITWTRKSQSLTVGTQYTTIVWNGTNWIIGALMSTNNYIYATTPSGTWTAGLSYSGIAGVQALYYDGTRTIWAENGKWWYATGTTITTGLQYYYVKDNIDNPTSGVNSTNNSYYYYNSKIYDGAGIYMQSWSTVPNAAQLSTDMSTPTISPTSYITGLSTLDYASGLMFADSKGQIVCSTAGSLYTSF